MRSCAMSNEPRPQSSDRGETFYVVAVTPGETWSVKPWGDFANLKGKTPEESHIGHSGDFSVGTVVP